MQPERTRLRSEMGRSTATHITVQGTDLCSEVMGKLNLGDFAFLEIQGRVPSMQESVMFNAMLATLVEHGMTPMVLAARLTYLGAPESLQAAVAAGLCGVGSTFAGTAEGAARMLRQALSAADGETDMAVLAKAIVAEYRAAHRAIPGIGHTLHKPLDPRTTRLFDLAREQGMHGRYVMLMKEVSLEAERVFGKVGQLPVNATGALGALCCELDIPWRLCRGLAVIGRSIGIVGHLAEELRNPIARTLWERTEEETSSAQHPQGDAS